MHLIRRPVIKRRKKSSTMMMKNKMKSIRKWSIIKSELEARKVLRWVRRILLSTCRLNVIEAHKLKRKIFRKSLKHFFSFTESYFQFLIFLEFLFFFLLFKLKLIKKLIRLKKMIKATPIKSRMIIWWRETVNHCIRDTLFLNAYVASETAHLRLGNEI